MVPCISMEASVADDYPIDVAKVDGRVGASMPYTRYDSEEAQLIGGAQLLSSPNGTQKPCFSGVETIVCKLTF